MLKNQATGIAHGKIILMGEHAVVYNEPAIALPLKNLLLKAQIIPHSHLYIECDFYTGLISSMPELFKSLKTLIYTILTEINREDATFKLKLTSDIPIERGMGSSAAVAVATTKAIYNYFNLNLTKEKLLSLVNIAETIAHGKPSGIDALLTSSNEAYYFIKNQKPLPISMNLDATLIVADTGITGQTKLAVQNVKNLVKKRPETNLIIKKIGKLTNQAHLAMQNNDLNLLGNVMTKAHQALISLQISNKNLDRLVNLSLINGAYGAKLTGGGLGGCMIALVDTQEAQKIAEILKENGAKKTCLLDLKGLTYEKSNSTSAY